MPAEIRRSTESWVGCIAGALEENVYRGKLFAAGFEAIKVEPTRIYTTADASDFLKSAQLDASQIAPMGSS